MAKCPKCGAEVSANAKFCEECGEAVPKPKESSDGVSLGDKNVVAGDVIGNKIAGDSVQNKILGNAVFNTFKDDTKIVNDCAVCGKHMTNDRGHTCPRCGKIVCEECFNREKRCCENCLNVELEKQQEAEKAKKAALEAEKAERAKTLFTDPRDGNTYKLVKIGNQTWFAENFRYDCGDGCWSHDDDESEEITKKYGYLYTWGAAVDFCPEGFHLPTKEEWLELFSSLAADSDDSSSIAKKMMTANGWNGKNTSGFNARPSGFIVHNLLDEKNELSDYHEQTSFWSSTKVDDNGVHFDFDGKSIEQGCDELDDGLHCIVGLSVRYIKDEIGGVVPTQASKIAICSCCKKIYNSKNKVECPECGKTVCEKCFVPAENQCISCKRKKAAALQKKLQAEEDARLQAEAERKRTELKAKLPENQGYFVDPRDGIAYKVVKIGNQVWFAENFRNENRDFVDPEGNQNSKEYGYLYSQDCAKQLAPKGWRLPSERDFETLLSYVKENGALQEPSDEDVARSLMAPEKWENCSTTDDFGFSALPAGYEQNGVINGEGSFTCFLSSSRRKFFQLDGFVAIASIEDVRDYGYSDLEGHYPVRYIKEDSSFSKTLEEAQVVAREQAAEIAKQEAEEKARQEAENARRAAEEAKRAAEEKAKQEAEKARREAEEKARVLAEMAEATKRAAEAKAKQEAEAARRAAEEARLEAEWRETHGFFVDPRDKEVYKVVKIGDQVWLGENFRYNCDGSYACDAKKYGRLYNQNDAKRLAPKGWHLPSKAEYEALIAYAKINGIKSDHEIARALAKKDAWPGEFGRDAFDFDILPAGCGSNFVGVGETAYLWTKDDKSFDIELAWCFCLKNSSRYLDFRDYVKKMQSSVRYIKDDSSFAKTLEEAQEIASVQAAEIAKQEAEEAKLAAEKVKQEAEQAKLEAEKVRREAEEAKRTATKQPSKNDSPLAFVLALIAGWLGVHNFYMGQTVRGVSKIVLFIVACILAGVLSNPNASVAAFILIAFVPSIIDVALMFKATDKLVNKIIAIIHFVVYGLLAIMGIIGLFAE